MSDVERPDGGAEPEECVAEKVGDEDDSGLWDPFEEEHEVELTSRKVMQEDGMPGEVARDASDDLPPLSRESMICMGLFDRFVLRDDWGDVVVEFKPDVVERAPNGSWRVKRGDFVAASSTLTGPKSEALKRMHNAYGEWVEVFPVRPPCRHYLRQAMPYDKNPRHRKFFRMCSLRRSSDGAMMNVGDTAVWACEGRDPRHPPSEEMLERFDDMKIEQGKKRVKLPIVGPSDDEAAGGIFGNGGKND
jgi:hypothetical protein